MEFAMMWRDSGLQPKLFYDNLNLEKRVPLNHLLGSRRRWQTIRLYLVQH